MTVERLVDNLVLMWAGKKAALMVGQMVAPMGSMWAVQMAEHSAVSLVVNWAE